MSQKGFAPILIIFVTVAIIGLIGGVFFLSKQSSQSTLPPKNMPSSTTFSPDQTADWKTYENNEFKFSIKYPDHWEVSNITNEPIWIAQNAANAGRLIPLKDFYRIKHQEDLKLIITFLNSKSLQPIVPKKGSGEGWISGLRLEIKQRTKDKEIEQYTYDKYRPKYLREELKVNGIDVTKLSAFNERYGLTISTALLERDGLLFILSNDTPGIGEGHEFFDQILATFRFADQKQGTTTANWKTYTGSKYGYEIKHLNLSENKCSVAGTSDTDVMDISFTKGESKEDTGYCGLFTIAVIIDRNKNITLSQKIEQWKSFRINAYNDTQQDLSISNIRVGSYSATKLISKKNQFQTIYLLTNPNNAMIYSIISQNNDSVEKEIDQILATFKFTN